MPFLEMRMVKLIGTPPLWVIHWLRALGASSVHQRDDTMKIGKHVNIRF